MMLMIGLLVIQIVIIWLLGIEPRHPRLENLRPEEQLAERSIEII
jgi:putative MFS transporter